MPRVLAIAAVALACMPAGASADSPATWPRVHRDDLAYRGAFRLPAQVDDRRTFAYGGTALAYHPKRNSLFAVGHDWYQLTAEVTIPKLARSAGVGGLRRARFLQGFADATDGAIDRTEGDGSRKVGGQLVHRGRLYGTAYVYYDASGSQVRSHWVRPSTDLTAGTASGPYRVGRLGAGMVSGYMADVPRRWRERLGGPVLTGNCCIPIISRTSFGPAAFAFDPRTLGANAPATALVYYPQDHATIGAWDATWGPRRGVYFNGSTTVRAVVFPRRTRSVLFVGTQGTGRFCYGEGTANRSLDGKPTPDGTTWCYDPDDSSKGTHAYPYVPQVWAYDASRLAAVARSDRRPWRVKPYATWRLPLPYGSGRIGGAAYDGRRGRIYVSQQYADGPAPVIHAFDLPTSAGSTAPVWRR